MQITENFIELISHDNTLNKEQSKILELSFPLNNNWKEEVLNKEILKNDANRLMLAAIPRLRCLNARFIRRLYDRQCYQRTNENS